MADELETVPVIISGGIRIRVPYVNEKIFELMNRCDWCRCEGSLRVNFRWSDPYLLCHTCSLVWDEQMKIIKQKEERKQ